MKTRILFGIGLLSAFLCYKNFPEYYFAMEPLCNPSFVELNSEAYEQAVLDSLNNKKPSDFRYFFQNFQQEGAQNYIIVNMRNETTCFNAKILVEKWDKLAGMKRTDGVSYPKELHDLKWKLEEREGRSVVVFQDMRTIID